MGLLRLLLKEYPRLAKAFRDIAIGLAVWAEIDLEAIKKWFDSSPQAQQQMLQQPTLDGKVEALFIVYLKLKDSEHDVQALKREILKLPALPSEGF